MDDVDIGVFEWMMLTLNGLMLKLVCLSGLVLTLVCLSGLMLALVCLSGLVLTETMTLCTSVQFTHAQSVFHGSKGVYFTCTQEWVAHNMFTVK